MRRYRPRSLAITFGHLVVIPQVRSSVRGHELRAKGRRTDCLTDISARLAALLPRTLDERRCAVPSPWFTGRDKRQEPVPRLAEARRWTGSPASIRAALIGIAGLFAAEVVRAVLGGWMNVATWKVRLVIDYVVREQVIAKLHRVPVAWHEQSSVRALVLTVNQSIPALGSAVADVLAALGGLVHFVLALLAVLGSTRG